MIFDFFFPFFPQQRLDYRKKQKKTPLLFRRRRSGRARLAEPRPLGAEPHRPANGSRDGTAQPLVPPDVDGHQGRPRELPVDAPAELVPRDVEDPQPRRRRRRRRREVWKFPIELIVREIQVKELRGRGQARRDRPAELVLPRLDVREPLHRREKLRDGPGDRVERHFELVEVREAGRERRRDLGDGRGRPRRRRARSVVADGDVELFDRVSERAERVDGHVGTLAAGFGEVEVCDAAVAAFLVLSGDAAAAAADPAERTPIIVPAGVAARERGGGRASPVCQGRPPVWPSRREDWGIFFIFFFLR